MINLKGKLEGKPQDIERMSDEELEGHIRDIKAAKKKAYLTYIINEDKRALGIDLDKYIEPHK